MHICDRYHCSHAYSWVHTRTQANPAQKGSRRGGGKGEREVGISYFGNCLCSPFCLLKRGKEEGKCGVVCPSLDSQQNKRFMGGRADLNASWALYIWMSHEVYIWMHHKLYILIASQTLYMQICSSIITLPSKLSSELTFENYCLQVLILHYR